MKTEKVEFENSRGQKIVGILDLPQEKNPEIIIICHSFTGYKELKQLHAIAKKSVEKGFAALRFDFSDCIGESGGTCEEMKLDNQVNDAISALDFVETLEGINKEKIGICGHSLGGTTAINAAVDNRVKALVSIAALAKPEWEHLFDDEKVKQWKQQGWIEFQSHKKGPVKINYSFYENIIKHKCGETIKEINCPVRVLHGTKDELLDLMNAAYLYDNAKEPKDIKLIENADHLFLTSPYMEKMAELTVDWFEKNLK